MGSIQVDIYRRRHGPIKCLKHSLESGCQDEQIEPMYKIMRVF